MRRILVVDDEQPVRTMVTRILKEKGYDTHTEDNGWDGLQAARSYMPDLVVCDIEMPHLDGHGMLEKLRSDPLTEAIPFIFLTASDRHEDIRKGMEKGADDYLTKPFSPEELCRALETRLARQELWRKKLNIEIEQLRKRIAYSFPHELRTPLTGIIGGASILNDEEYEMSVAEMRDIARLILLSGERLNSLVEKYLRYIELIEFLGKREEALALRSRLIDRQKNFNMPPADLLEQAIRLKAETAGREKHILVSLDDIPGHIYIEDLKEIATELLQNAFAFSREGTPVEVTGVRSGSRYLLSVHDRGRGIPQEKIEKLGAFVQVDRPYFEQQGMGMGIAIVKKIMELYNGELIIQSKVNDFTKVTASFPGDSH